MTSLGVAEIDNCLLEFERLLVNINTSSISSEKFQGIIEFFVYLDEDDVLNSLKERKDDVRCTSTYNNICSFINSEGEFFIENRHILCNTLFKYESVGDILDYITSE